VKACINRVDESVGRQWTMEASVAGLLCGAKVDGGIKEIGLCGENWTLIGVELCNYGSKMKN